MVIELSGPNGNTFALAAIGKNLCKQLGWDWEPIRDDLFSGDYNHVLAVMEGNFGHVIELEMNGEPYEVVVD
jgi:hypothetical protein